MATYNDIYNSVSFIPEVKRETAGIINIAGKSVGLHANTGEDIYDLACKVLYCKYSGETAVVELPIDSSAIGYTGINQKYLTVVGVEIYRTQYGTIDDIVYSIKNDITASKNVITSWNSKEDKTTIESWQNNPSCKFFPVIDTSTVTTVNGFCNGSTIRMVGYLDFSSVTSLNNAFNASNLEVLNLDNLGCDLDISFSTKMSIDSVEYIIDHSQVVENKALTVSKTLINKVTDYYSNLATQKGWTINFE